MIRLILLGIAGLCSFAQTHVAISTQTGVTSDKVTLAHDPSNQTRIQVCAISITMSVTGTVYTEVSGTAATATALTKSPTSPGGKTAKALAYGNSDVGSGTRTSPTYVTVANVPFNLDMKNVYLNGNGTTKNLTAVIGLDASGNVTTAVYWAEDGKCESR